MIDRQAFAKAMTGSVMLMTGNSAGLAQFDLSVDGFWRSFQAAIVTAPAYALLLVAQPHRGGEVGLGGWQLATSGALTFVFGWLLFPLIALVLCRYYDLSQRYVTLIVAVNWTAVPQIMVFLLAVLLSLALPAPIATLLLLMTTVAVMYIQWFVIRTALATNALTAIGFLVLDIILNQTLQTFIDSAFSG